MGNEHGSSKSFSSVSESETYNDDCCNGVIIPNNLTATLTGDCIGAPVDVALTKQSWSGHLWWSGATGTCEVDIWCSLATGLWRWTLTDSGGVAYGVLYVSSCDPFQGTGSVTLGWENWGCHGCLEGDVVNVVVTE